MNSQGELPEVSASDGVLIRTIEALIKRVEDPYRAQTMRALPQLALDICSEAPNRSTMLAYQLQGFFDSIRTIEGGEVLEIALALWTHIGQALIAHPYDHALCVLYLTLTEAESSKLLLRAAAQLATEEKELKNTWEHAFKQGFYLRRIASSFYVFEEEVRCQLKEIQKLQKSGELELRPGILGYPSLSGACTDRQTWLRMFNVPGTTGKQCELALSLASAASELLLPTIILLSSSPAAFELFKTVTGYSTATVSIDQVTEELWTFRLKIETLGSLLIACPKAASQESPEPSHIKIHPTAAVTTAQQTLPNSDQMEKSFRLLACLGLSHVVIPEK